MELNVLPQHLEEVRKIVGRFFAGQRVIAFGSRARNTNRASSDLDLGVYSHAPIDLSTSAQLRLAFSESDIPYFVDVVDMKMVDTDFRELIEKDAIVVQEGNAL